MLEGDHRLPPRRQNAIRNCAKSYRIKPAASKLFRVRPFARKPNSIAKMTIKKRAFRALATVILLGTIGAAALYWRLASAKSVADPDGVATENVWNSVLCRGQLYLQKAEGEVSDISWAELWSLTLPGRGYHCTEGSSLEFEPSVQHGRQRRGPPTGRPHLS